MLGQSSSVSYRLTFGQFVQIRKFVMIQCDVHFRYLRICGIILSATGVLLAASALAIFSCFVLKKQEKNVTYHCPEVSEIKQFCNTLIFTKAKVPNLLQ